MLNISTTSKVAAIGSQLASYLNVCANLSNQITSMVLNQSNDDLAEWLNTTPDTTALFIAHGQLGDAINTASTVAMTFINGSAIDVVDTRTVAEKLAEQGREIAFENGAYVVRALPISEPETAPEPEPQPE